jgi:hypothetical protein
MLDNCPTIKLFFKSVVTRKFFPYSLFLRCLISPGGSPLLASVENAPGANQKIEIMRARLTVFVIHINCSSFRSTLHQNLLILLPGL